VELIWFGWATSENFMIPLAALRRQSFCLFLFLQFGRIKNNDPIAFEFVLVPSKKEACDCEFFNTLYNVVCGVFESE
jgi:hypothetical protein